MKLTKENIYVSLIGKTKEELTELYWLLKNNNEPLTRKRLNYFIEYPLEYQYISLDEESWNGYDGLNNLKEKTEVTIEQLKQIIKPMETFTPIAMKCNKDQFYAIKTKLEKIGKIGNLLFAFEDDNLYLVNNFNGEKFIFDISYCDGWNRKVHEEWNEEIFLKACGIEVESLQQQLQKAVAEVKRLQDLIEEENKPKVGDVVFAYSNDLEKSGIFELSSEYDVNFLDIKEIITDPNIIKYFK